MIEIRRLHQEDFHYLDKIADDVFDDPIVKSAAQEFLADIRHCLVVALEDDLVVGFVSGVIYLHPDKTSPELWINEVGVAPTHQRQGIGKALLQTILASAKQSGCREAWVLTERTNLAAMAMYKTSGGIEAIPDPTMFTFTL